MSQENVEVIRRDYEVFEAYGFAAPADVYDELFHPDAEVVPPAIYPDTEPSYSGFEGFQRWSRQVDEMWDDWHFEPERFFDAGDQVVVFVRVSATGTQSRVAVEMATAHVFTLRDGRIARVEIFLDRQEALKAVGLEG
jgi:ketosteroid isomerase-like protein